MTDSEYGKLLKCFRVHIVIIFIGIWYILSHLFRKLIYHWMKTIKTPIVHCPSVLSSSGSTIRHIDNYFKLIAEAERQLIYKLHHAVTNR